MANEFGIGFDIEAVDGFTPVFEKALKEAEEFATKMAEIMGKVRESTGDAFGGVRFPGNAGAGPSPFPVSASVVDVFAQQETLLQRQMDIERQKHETAMRQQETQFAVLEERRERSAAAEERRIERLTAKRIEAEQQVAAAYRSAGGQSESWGPSSSSAVSSYYNFGYDVSGGVRGGYGGPRGPRALGPWGGGGAGGEGDIFDATWRHTRYDPPEGPPRGPGMFDNFNASDALASGFIVGPMLSGYGHSLTGKADERSGLAMQIETEGAKERAFTPEFHGPQGEAAFKRMQEMIRAQSLRDFYGVTQIEYAKHVEDIAQYGIGPEMQQKFMPLLGPTEALFGAGNMPLMIKSLVAAVRTNPKVEPTHIMDVLAKTLKESGIRPEEYPFAAQYVMGTAAAKHIPYEEVAAMIGSLATAGVMPSRIGTGLDSMLNSLYELDKKTGKSKIMDATGVNPYNADDTYRDPVQLLSEIFAALSGKTEKQRQFVEEQLFPDKRTRRPFELLYTGRDIDNPGAPVSSGFRDMNSLYKDLASSGTSGALLELSAIVTHTTAKTMQDFDVKMQMLNTDMGEGIKSFKGFAASMASPAVRWLVEHGSGTKEAAGVAGWVAGGALSAAGGAMQIGMEAYFVRRLVMDVAPEFGSRVGVGMLAAAPAVGVAIAGSLAAAIGGGVGAYLFGPDGKYGPSRESMDKEATMDFYLKNPYAKGAKEFTVSHKKEIEALAGSGSGNLLGKVLGKNRLSTGLSESSEEAKFLLTREKFEVNVNLNGVDTGKVDKEAFRKMLQEMLPKAWKEYREKTGATSMGN